MHVIVERGEERQEWNKQKLPKALLGYSGGRLPGRSTKEKGKEEGKEDEGGEERRIKQIIKEVIAGIQKKDIDESVENKVKRTGGQSLVRNCDCSQIENEEEEESWQEGN